MAPDKLPKTPEMTPFSIFVDPLDREKENINPATGRHQREDWRPEHVLRDISQAPASTTGDKTPGGAATPQSVGRQPLRDITPLVLKAQSRTAEQDQQDGGGQQATKKEPWGYGSYGGYLAGGGAGGAKRVEQSVARGQKVLRGFR